VYFIISTVYGEIDSYGINKNDKEKLKEDKSGKMLCFLIYIFFF